jgi:poly(A) polymerase
VSGTRLPHLVEPGSLPHELGERFEQAGHELFLIGGTVRDALLRRTAPDMDFATDAKPTEVLRLMRGYASEIWLNGVAFGTVGARVRSERVEITTYREEWYPPESRNPEVHFARDISSDLSRRDFAINAIAVRCPGADVLDPFGGIQDLARRLIRTPRSPEQAFTDDPLRMLRACRFASTLDFDVAPEITDAIASMRERLRIVSMERVRDELSKLLVGVRPSRGLDLIVRTGLAELILPELPRLAMEQDPVHRHKDVLRHTYAVVERVPPDLVSRMAALMHDVGKPATRAFGPGGVSFHHHEVVGADMAVARLRELRYPSAFIESVRRLVFLHLRFHTYRLGWADSAVRRYVRDAGDLLDKLNALVRADCTTRNEAKARELQERMDTLEARIADLAEREELSRLRPSLDGHDVMALYGWRPSRQVGEALSFLLELRLEKGPLARKEAFAELERWGRERGHEPVRSAEEAAALADEARARAEEEEDTR